MQKMKTTHLETGIQYGLRPVLALILSLCIGVHLSAHAQDSRLASAAPMPFVTIDVSAQNRVDHEQICLADIASIRIDDAALERRIGQIRIESAPLPGKQRTLLGRKVAEAIQSQAWMPPNAHISLPEIIKVRRSFQPVPVKQLKAFFMECLTNHFGDEDFNLKRFKVRGDKILPVGTLSFRLAEPVQTAKSHRMIAAVTVLADNREAGHLELVGWINRFEPVVCASRTIPKNRILTESDLTMEMMNVSKLPSSALYDIQDALGRQTKRAIQRGTCLRSNLLQLAPIVEKGDKVKLVAAKGLLNVTTLGIAQEAGGKGEQIRIQNVTSGKIVMGEVANASTVTVLF
jgi:flagella basal body P-ring formation protein FlgA